MHNTAFLPILVLAGVLAALPVQAQELERFFGSYVGSGAAVNVVDNSTDVRDLDVTIEPYKNDGFTLRWITVIREGDAARTDPEVRRRAEEENFLPSEDLAHVYVIAPKGSLFEKAELPNPLRGEAMRWASIDGDRLTVHSLGIVENGGVESQIFHRTLTDTGMDVRFVRMQDDEVLLRVTGELVRAE